MGAVKRILLTMVFFILFAAPTSLADNWPSVARVVQNSITRITAQDSQREVTARPSASTSP